MRPMPDPSSPRRGSGSVARTLATGAMCINCLVDRTGLDLERVRDAISELDADRRLIHHVGRCPSCLKRDRALLKLDESAKGRRASPGTYDRPDAHGPLRCAKCGRPTGPVGQGVVLSGGQPYHTTCFNSLSRHAGSGSGGAETAALVCKCEHPREMHQYERSRRAWTVCRVCRCVRFKAPSPPPPQP